ncbi:MAG: sigma-70 family RNA polymerase sigma factor [Myxococcota bacterium]
MTPEEIVDEYRGLVTDTAVKIADRLETDVPVEDMLNWGFRGLLEAYERFSPTDRDNSFSSFAFYRIRGAIYDGLRKSGWGTRGTACEIRDSLAINEYLESNFRANQEVPTAKTFADSVNYLDEMVGSCVMICLVSQHELALLQHKTPPTQRDSVAKEKLAIALQKAAEELEELEQDVLQRHVLEEESLSSIAADYGFSKSWVSRVNARALDKLRTLIFGTTTQEGILDGADPEDFMTDR